MSTSNNNPLNQHLWLAITVTLFAIILIREISVLIAIELGIPSMGNIIGMVSLFLVLLLWRRIQGLPAWLTLASNKILTESAFAYLPVSAGAGILLFKLGDEFTRIMIVMLVSTIVPLWGFAKLSEYWLNPSKVGQSITPSNPNDNNDKE